MTGRQWLLVILAGLLIVFAPVTMGHFVEHAFSSFITFFQSFNLH